LLLSSEVLFLSGEVLVLSKQVLVLPKHFLLLPEQILPRFRRGFVPVWAEFCPHLEVEGLRRVAGKERLKEKKRFIHRFRRLRRL
jgi:hypothetical protein